MKYLINYVNNKYQHLMTLLKPAHDQSTIATIDDSISQESSMLESRVKGAIQFLRTTRLNRQNKTIQLNDFPWYLLIGQVESGKTSLLANSNMNFILEKLSTQQGVKGVTSNQCDWWVSQELVLIDVPGNFTTLKTRKLSHTNKLWHSFINHITKWRGKDALSGVIITISLPEMMQRQQREQLIDSLKYQISFLKEKFGADLPFYFVLTKCDLIPGFVDFFGDSSAEELSQAWGIPFNDEASVEEAFINRFNSLIKRLNKQLIWRLHQERNPRAKVYIKDFPLQVERVKEALFEVIQSLVQSNAGHCQIKGIYLTSALQPTYQEEKQQQSYPQTVSGDAFQQSLQIMKAPEIPAQSYFIKHFFTQALPSTRTQAKGWSMQWLFSGATTAVLLVLAIMWGKDALFSIPGASSQLTVAQSISSTQTNQLAINPAASNLKLT